MLVLTLNHVSKGATGINYCMYICGYMESVSRVYMWLPWHQTGSPWISMNTAITTVCYLSVVTTPYPVSFPLFDITMNIQILELCATIYNIMQDIWYIYIYIYITAIICIYTLGLWIKHYVLKCWIPFFPYDHELTKIGSWWIKTSKWSFDI